MKKIFFCSVLQQYDGFHSYSSSWYVLEKNRRSRKFYQTSEAFHSNNSNNLSSITPKNFIETSLYPNSDRGEINQSLEQMDNIRFSSCVFSPTAVTRFLNFLTKKGKKSKARFILNKTLYLLTTKSLALNPLNRSSESNPSNQFLSEIRPDSLYILNEALSNVKPFFEVKKVRVAGTTYQVPSLVQPARQESLAIHWIIDSAFERKKKNPLQPFENCLAYEIYEAYQKQGQARVKRNELHKLAEVNRAFSHFRWW